jgi:ABC-2 type transport system ATP-binding protein
VLAFESAERLFGDLAALDSCTFAARPGRLTGLLAPNGAGETTATRAVSGLVELDDGQVSWRSWPVGATGARPSAWAYRPR